MSRINHSLLWPRPEFCTDFGYFSNYEQLEIHAQLSWAWKKFYNLRAWSTVKVLWEKNK